MYSKAWIGWILASACFLALYDLAKKASVRENAVIPVLLCSTTFGCLAFALGLWATGGFAKAWALVDGKLLALAASKSVIVATSWIFTFCALRTLPITIATPIRASAPALVIVAAFFIYGEIPSWVQAVGIVSVLAGYWMFSWAGKAEGIDFFRNRAVWCAIAGCFFSAVSSMWDKYVFQVVAAPVEPVQLFFQLGLVVVYGICLAFEFVTRRGAEKAHHAFEWRWTIPCVGTLLAAADWLYFHGLAVPGAPVSLGSLMRRLSVAITFVLGAFLFHETNLRRKGIALAFVLIGIILMCF